MSGTNGTSHVQPDLYRHVLEPSPEGPGWADPLQGRARPDARWAEALVIDTLVELTHYPREVLIPAAHLEEDLGIDSVKRGEIFAVLRSRLGGEATGAALSAKPPATIADVIDLVMTVASAAPDSVAAPPPPAGARPAAPPVAAASPAPVVQAPGALDPRALVLDTIAELTRYPRDILSDDAELEEDLGIDSVKRGEIVATLGKRLGLDPRAAMPPGTAPRTVGQLVKLTTDVLESTGRRVAPVATPAPAPAPMTAAAPAPALAPRSAEPKTSFTNPSISPRIQNGAHAPAPPSAARPATAVASAGTPLLDQPILAGQPAKVFQDRVALVTGSGHGLGRVIALQLAELGAKVIVNSFYSRERGEATAAEINGRFPGSAVHLWGSIANRRQLDGIFDQIDQRFGCLDFYVQNASNGVIGPLDQVTEDHWDRGFRTNVVGFHRAAFRAAELMKRRGGGRIVALSSPGAQRYLEYFGCLGPIKAAVESLALYLAVDLGPHNIQVNVVSAGPVYGERLSNYPDSERLIPYWEQLSADRKLGDATEISSSVLYLLSPAARKINGSVVLVDGAASQRM